LGLTDLAKDAASRLVSGTSDITGRVMAASQGRWRGNRAPQAPIKQSEIPADMQQAMFDVGMATGPFTPGEPMPPYQPIGEKPVITPFPVGYNIWAIPRGMAGVGFSTMKSILSSWDLAQACIEVRQDAVRSLDWDIVAEDEDDNERYADELKAAKRFFQRPDGYSDFDTLQAKALEDYLRYDALSIYPHRTRGGKLGSLEVLDGTIIAPLVDARGAMPRYPAPAYVQWAWGLPWQWLTEKDLVYIPSRPRAQTRYGLAPIEWVLVPANTDLRLQYYFLSYFTEGEVPEVFINAPKEATNPEQIKALQNAYSATMSGARAAHHKVKWIPPDSKAMVINKGRFDTAFASWLMTRCFMGFKVQPAEAGYTENVNKSSGDSQENVQFRRGLKPDTRYFARVWNHILDLHLGMPYARFKYLGIEEEEDQLILAQTRNIYVQMGALSSDEVRQELGYDVDPDAPVGRAVYTPRGLIFVDPKSQAAARAQGGLLQPQAGGDPNAPVDGDDNTQDPQWLSPDQGIVDPVIEPQPTQEGQPNQQAPTQPPDTGKAIRDDLRKWQQSAVRRAKEGRRQKPFQSDAIPEDVYRLVETRLAKATTPEEVRAAFPTSGRFGLSRAAQTQAPAAEEEGVLADGILRELLRRMAPELHSVLAKEAPAIARDLAQAVVDTISGITQRAAATGSSIAEPTDLEVQQVLDHADWSGIGDGLRAILQPNLEVAFAHGGERGLNLVGAAEGNVNQAAIDYAERRGAELVGMHRLPDGTFVPSSNGYAIDQATRDMLRVTVRDAIANEEQYNVIRKKIVENHAFSYSRADTIARTELGMAYNRGNIAAWRQQGVSYVQVFDGEEFDQACRDADGSIWTMDQAEADPLEHPRCVRAFAPVEVSQGG